MDRPLTMDDLEEMDIWVDFERMWCEPKRELYQVREGGDFVCYVQKIAENSWIVMDGDKAIFGRTKEEAFYNACYREESA